jgi:hypothetical protein
MNIQQGILNNKVSCRQQQAILILHTGVHPIAGRF